MVKDPNTAASDLNHDLGLVGQWAYVWRMSLNPDPQKQLTEVTFSRKKIEVDHTMILFNNIPVRKVSKHKHLRIILDSKLSFSTHTISAISEMRKGIGLLKYLYINLPRDALNKVDTFYVRPHLDYGDVTYCASAKYCTLYCCF